MTCFDCFDMMIAAGIGQNSALLIFDNFINGYASNVHAGKPVPVSRAARHLLANGGSKRDIILEHGTPRRALSLLLMKRRAGLTEAKVKELVEAYWAIAYITKDEDQRLRDLGLRSTMKETPQARWAAAGIEF
jgi:hypothetical protein